MRIHCIHIDVGVSLSRVPGPKSEERSKQSVPGKKGTDFVFNGKYSRIVVQISGLPSF